MFKKLRFLVIANIFNSLHEDVVVFLENVAFVYAVKDQIPVHGPHSEARVSDAWLVVHDLILTLAASRKPWQRAFPESSPSPRRTCGTPSAAVRPSGVHQFDKGVQS
jgi:hypothetical protein